VQFAPIMALISERLLRAVPHEEREAAVLDGASLIARWKARYWPAVWPGVAAGALVVFALTLGEEGAAVLLLPPGPTTLGVRLLTLMHYAPTGQVSALCLLMMVPGVLAFLLAAGFVYLRQRG
jgi:ABC-type Fe3+ transport system permease subunit